MSSAPENAMTLANRITIFRILLVPLCVIALVEKNLSWALGLFAAASLTDFLDGATARALGEKSRLGMFLDPAADKLLLVSTYLSLVYIGRLPMWVFVVVFSRDLLIFLGWSIIYILTRNSTVEPRPLGKITTLAQMAAAMVFILPVFEPWSVHAKWAMVALTTMSALDYVWVGARRLGELG